MDQEGPSGGLGLNRLLALFFFAKSGWRMRYDRAVGSIVALAMVAACSGGRNSSVLPNSATSIGDGANRIVAAYGASEQEVSRVIADASSYGKSARFVGVNYLAGTYGSPASHVFPPTANVAQTGKALVVIAYGKVFVWRLADVELTYKGAIVPLSGIPVISHPQLDVLVARVAAATDQTLTRTKIDRRKLSNAAAVCHDCMLVFQQKSPNAPSPTGQVVVDPWQRDPDYVSWVDPALQNRVVPTEPPVPKTASSSQTRHLSRWFWYSGGGGWQWGSGSNGYYCFWSQGCWSSWSSFGSSSPLTIQDDVSNHAVTNTQQTAVVGQLINLEAKSQDSLTGCNWTVPGTIVGSYDATTGAQPTPATTSGQSLKYYWTDSASASGSVTATCTDTDFNQQVSATVQYAVNTPTANVDPEYGQILATQNDYDGNGWFLHFGYPGQGPYGAGVYWTYTISGGYDGQIAMVQKMVSENTTTTDLNDNVAQNPFTNCLDVVSPYLPAVSASSTWQGGDAPAHQLSGYKQVRISQHSRDYFMYQPPSGIWVTLATLDWSFDAQTMRTSEPTVGFPYGQYSSAQINSMSTPPVTTPSVELPTWGCPFNNY